MKVEKLFDSVAFPELEQPKEEAKLEGKKTNPEKQQARNIEVAMAAFHTQAMRIISAVQSGESNLRSAINLKGSAILSVADKLVKNPSGPNLKEFLEIAQQDLGRRVKQELEKILDGEECKTLKTL